MYRRNGWFAPFFGVALLGFLLISCNGGGQGGTGGATGTALPSAAKTLDKTLGESTISDIAEQTIDSVVNISTTKTVKVQPGQYGVPFDDPFFQRFFGGGDRRNRPETRRESSLGSGVIVNADGTILTNNHVVRDADKVVVTLNDKRRFDAEVVGTDPASDVAVIRLKKKADNLKPLPIGDSDKLRLGEVVLAIGNPFGLDHTVTMGIVSAKGRSNVGVADYEDFIQTDAAINPGNSGGALINLRGELVGVNTAIASSTGEYQGIGFAIPSNMAKSIMDTLVKGKKIVRGWLGVGIDDVTPDVAEALDLKDKGGVLVKEVHDGPAKNAGIQPGDIILTVDGRAMGSVTELRNTIARLGANKKTNLGVFRDGRKLTLAVTLAERPTNPQTAMNRGEKNEKSRSFDGFEVGSLSAEMRDGFQIPASVKSGVVVTSVEDGGAAAEAGLAPGDVIVKVNNRAVDSVDAFTREYGKSKDKVLLYFWRGGTYNFRILSKK